MNTEPVRRLFGADEFVLIGALVLLTAGLWSAVGMLALVAPGAALLWIAVPSRAPFVIRPEAPQGPAVKPERQTDDR